MTENSNSPGRHDATSGVERLLHKRDFYAGGLMVLLGLFMALKGPTYNLGTLMHMGPGFMPTALGVILILLGVAIAATSLAQSDDQDERILPDDREWFAWVCILASPVAFIVFGSYFGLAPAAFACVFVAAMGNRGMTLKSMLVLSTVMTVIGIIVFSYLLQTAMPVITWRGL
jgi:hypothetical protein